MSTFKLIDGIYQIPDARKLTLHLVSEKINYLTLRHFSDMERYATDISHAQRRLRELRQLEKDIQAYFDDMDKIKGELNVSSFIHIRPKNE